jgi:hypothetical protein
MSSQFSRNLGHDTCIRAHLCDDGREPLKPPHFTFAFPKTLPMMETGS